MDSIVSPKLTGSSIVSPHPKPHHPQHKMKNLNNEDLTKLPGNLTSFLILDAQRKLKKKSSKSSQKSSIANSQLDLATKVQQQINGRHTPSEFRLILQGNSQSSIFINESEQGITPNQYGNHDWISDNHSQKEQINHGLNSKSSNHHNPFEYKRQSSQYGGKDSETHSKGARTREEIQTPTTSKTGLGAHSKISGSDSRYLRSIEKKTSIVQDESISHQDKIADFYLTPVNTNRFFLPNQRPKKLHPLQSRRR